MTKLTVGTRYFADTADGRAGEEYISRMRYIDSYAEKYWVPGGRLQSRMWSRLPAITAFCGFLIGGSVAAASVTSSAADERSIVIIGASYAEDWPVDMLADHVVTNKGVGGNQTSDMVNRFERDVLLEEPNAVLIWGFINDIFRADSTKFEQAKERIRTDYLRMITLAQENEIDIVVATEVTIRRKSGVTNWLASVAGRALGRTSYQDLINDQVRDVNDWLTGYAAKEGITVLDFESAIAGDDGNRRSGFAMDDGSHLNVAAYTALTEYATNTLRATGMARD